MPYIFILFFSPIFSGITKLINDKAAIPLHEGECDSSDEKVPRKWLMNNWALFSAIYKEQPLDDIKEYFGVKPVLYLAWVLHLHADLSFISRSVVFTVWVPYLLGPYSQ
ncbi:anoctamin-2-like [Tachypleus tridentatus]|uniref:anoctamin-2-like n=1 Tax=Tachypleus tridentatus TaxID=6853 RepID=UPI003FD02761